MSYGKEAYDAYINGPVWKVKRQEAIERDGKRCRLCYSSKKLHVHHRYYPQVYGEEPLTDLITLCQECHDLFHSNMQVSQQKYKEKKTASTRIVKRKEKRKNKREGKISPNKISIEVMRVLRESGIVTQKAQLPSISSIAMMICELQGITPDKVPTRKESRAITVKFLLSMGVDLSNGGSLVL